MLIATVIGFVVSDCCFHFFTTGNIKGFLATPLPVSNCFIFPTCAPINPWLVYFGSDLESSGSLSVA